MLSSQNSATPNSPADSFEVHSSTCDLETLHPGVALFHALSPHFVDCLLGGINGVLAEHENLVVSAGQFVRSSSFGFGKICSQSILRSEYSTPRHCDLRILDVNLPGSPSQGLRCAFGALDSILGLCFA
ncbi:hypothetical protein HG530_009872 [Fusarium avenaceum]|nr:hypothetical protein HG530_009872 [Fusarium avenaceum]